MFSSMFGMAGNYDSRKVGRDDFDWGFVSTCSVTDGEKPYETAVAHNEYRDAGNMVIVEHYDTKDEAAAGHAKWVQTMTTEPLPEKLVDCANAAIAQLAGAFGADFTYARKARATDAES